MKAVSCIFFIASAVLAGLKADRLKKNGINELREYIDMLKFIRSELNSELSLETIISNAEKVCRGKARATAREIHAALSANSYTSMNELWIETIERNRTLTEIDRCTLCEIGAVIGKYDSPVQAAYIDSVINRLEKRLLNLESDYAEKRRLYLLLPPLLVTIAIMVIY